MRFKLQSAMEYLMTYGWAILVIAVVLVALFSLGIFNGFATLGTTCIAQPGYICSNPILGHDAANTLTFQFGQNSGSTLYKVILYVAPQSATPNTFGFPSKATNGFGGSIQPAIPTLVPGAQNSVAIGMDPNNGLATNAIGTQFQGFIWMNYSTTPSGTPSSSARVATITVKVT